MATVPKVYTAVIHEAEEGGYWAEVLELPGCVTQGETLDEVHANIREAIEAVLEVGSEEPEVTRAPTPAYFPARETWTGTGGVA